MNILIQVNKYNNIKEISYVLDQWDMLAVLLMELVCRNNLEEYIVLMVMDLSSCIWEE